MTPLGKCTLECAKGEMSRDADFLKVNDKVQTAHIVLTRDHTLKEYSDVLEGLGCVDGPYHIELDETVKPVVHPLEKYL